MNPSNPQMDTNKPTNENWTQRYVDYDKEEPQPRDISNDYIKEEMVGNVRGVFIKTRNLEPNEIENRPDGGNINRNDNNETESSNVDKNKTEDKIPLSINQSQTSMGNNLLNDKSFMNPKNETTTFNPGTASPLNRTNESSFNAGNVSSINRGNEGSLNRPNESSLNRPNEIQSLNPRNETTTWNTGNDASNRLNEIPSLNPRIATSMDTNRSLDTNQIMNKTNVAGSSNFNQAQK